MIWVQANSPYNTITDLVEAGKATPGKIRFGGSQSKDVDQTLVRRIEAATGAKFLYIPFKSGSEAAVQLAGNHIDANTNNPAENVGQWRAGQAKPLCVMSDARMADTTKVTDTMSWNDIPTCREQGLQVDAYQMPRTVFAPADVPARRSPGTRPPEEGLRHAGVQGLPEEYLADRPLHDRRRVQVLHRRRCRALAQAVRGGRLARQLSA